MAKKRLYRLEKGDICVLRDWGLGRASPIKGGVGGGYGCEGGGMPFYLRQEGESHLWLEKLLNVTKDWRGCLGNMIMC